MYYYQTKLILQKPELMMRKTAIYLVSTTWLSLLMFATGGCGVGTLILICTRLQPRPVKSGFNKRLQCNIVAIQICAAVKKTIIC